MLSLKIQNAKLQRIYFLILAQYSWLNVVQNRQGKSRLKMDRKHTIASSSKINISAIINSKFDFREDSTALAMLNGLKKFEKYLFDRFKWSFYIITIFIWRSPKRWK